MFANVYMSKYRGLRILEDGKSSSNDNKRWDVMKAIGFEQYGDVTVLKEKDMPIPIPKEKQVLVETAYIAVNVYDAQVRRGMIHQKPLEQFYVPGNEVVGKVVQIGIAEEQFKVGDIVIGKTGKGGYAKYVAVGQNHTFLKPDNMSLELAASFSHTAVTAYWALKGMAQVEEGENIAIIGAAGSVGSFAVQLAKRMGLHVLAVASAKNEDYVKSLGADYFVDYHTDDATFDEQADIIIDASLLGRGGEKAVRYAKDGARFVGLNRLPKTTRDIQLIEGQRTEEMTDGEAMSYLLDLQTMAPLKMRAPTIFPFSAEGARAAHTAIESGHHDGKLLLKVRDL